MPVSIISRIHCAILFIAIEWAPRHPLMLRIAQALAPSMGLCPDCFEEARFVCTCWMVNDDDEESWDQDWPYCPACHSPRPDICGCSDTAAPMDDTDYPFSFYDEWDIEEQEADMFALATRMQAR
jgi:hypothetical protein